MKIKDGERKTFIEKNIIKFKNTNCFFYLNNEWNNNDLCLNVLKIIF